MYSCSYSMLSLFLFYQATYTKLYIFLSQCYAHMNTQMYIYWLIVTNTHIYTYKEKTFEHSNLHTNASVQILIKNKTQLNVLKYFFIWFLLYKKKSPKCTKYLSEVQSRDPLLFRCQSQILYIRRPTAVKKYIY